MSIVLFCDFIKPLNIKEIKKNFSNKLKNKPLRKYFTFERFEYYMRNIFNNNKKIYMEIRNNFKLLTYDYKSKNDCLKMHNEILYEILKYPKSNISDLMVYYYDNYNFPNYIKAIKDIDKREKYDIIYSFDFLNEKQLRNILFQFYFN
jgi:hypothetical protein